MAPAEFEEKGLPSSPEALDARFEAWTANKPYMFRLTEKLVKREMARIVASVGSQGGPAAAARAGAAAVSPPQRQLLEKSTLTTAAGRRWCCCSPTPPRRAPRALSSTAP